MCHNRLGYKMALLKKKYIFGLLMDQAKYHDILQLCTLQINLAHLEFGDQTEIGE